MAIEGRCIMSRILFVSVALLGLASAATADPSVRHAKQAPSIQPRHNDKSLGYEDGMERPPPRQGSGWDDRASVDSRVPPDAFNFVKAWNIPPSYWEIHSGR